MNGSRVRADRVWLASCACGRVALELMGEPIVRAVCYCKSCQEAGRLFDGSSCAPAVVGKDGGTEYVLFRKDRVRLVTGVEPDLRDPLRQAYAEITGCVAGDGASPPEARLLIGSRRISYGSAE